MLKLMANNGWEGSEEELLAEWSDKALCYRWLHDRTEKKFSSANMAFTIPVIILSTLTGTANFGMGSIFPENLQGIAQMGIGGVSLLAGIITTISNFMQYAQRMESHRTVSISWGKLQRKISVELALPRMQREKCMDFLLVCRSELDRLIEQSPSIPDDIISQFENRFKNLDMSKPEVCNSMKKTRIYVDTVKKTADITASAIFALKNKKTIKDEVIKRSNSPPLSTVINNDLKDKKASLLEKMKQVAKNPETFTKVNPMNESIEVKTDS